MILTYMREEKKENWEKVEELLEKEAERPIIIGGDFNARTRSEGGWIGQEEEPKKGQESTRN